MLPSRQASSDKFPYAQAAIPVYDHMRRPIFSRHNFEFDLLKWRYFLLPHSGRPRGPRGDQEGGQDPDLPARVPRLPQVARVGGSPGRGGGRQVPDVRAKDERVRHPPRAVPHQGLYFPATILNLICAISSPPNPDARRHDRRLLRRTLLGRPRPVGGVHATLLQDAPSQVQVCCTLRKNVQGDHAMVVCHYVSLTLI